MLVVLAALRFPIPRPHRPLLRIQRFFDFPSVYFLFERSLWHFFLCCPSPPDDGWACCYGCFCSVVLCFRRYTPLCDIECGKAFKAHVTYPPSPAIKRALQPLLDSGCKKLKSAGPTACMLETHGAPPTFSVLHTCTLRAAGKGEGGGLWGW